MHLRITDLRPYILVYATSAVVHHYQKTGNSWRPKTVRKAWNTVRNTIPDSSPSGIRRQESIVRKSEVLLSVGRQESFLVGSSWRPSWGCLEDQFLTVKTVRKLDKRAKKNIYMHADLHPRLQFHSSSKSNLYDSFIYMSFTIYTYRRWHPSSYFLKMTTAPHIHLFRYVENLIYHSA